MLMSNKVSFNFLCDKDVKDEFIKIAKDKDVTATQLLKKFMAKYVKKNKSDKNG